MSSIPLAIRARAKVNLFLNITGRRADGYHEIDSLFAFCDLADLVTVAAADDLLFEPPTGPFSAAVEQDGANLVMRAAALLRREAGVAGGARIGLVKNIPVAAGLGGGSADAAATLAGLNRFWNLHWPLARLEALALSLGADVPACLRTSPVYARGIGEQLSDAPELPDCGVILVNPLVATPTPAVFRRFRELNESVMPRRFQDLPARIPTLRALVDIIAERGNDLLPAAQGVTPEIGHVLEAMRGLPDVSVTGLSGSGATCFALLESRKAAATAAQTIQRQAPGWWVWSGGWAR